jgi:flagellar hook-associated protein 3 FlgL
MVGPISTAALFNALQSNIGATQTQVANYSNQVASQEVSTDLAGYGPTAGTLTAVNSYNSRLSSYVAGAQALQGQLGVQDQALTTVGTATQNATNAISEAIAQNSGDDLMTTLQSALTTAVGALNTQYGGSYLFSGGQGQTEPVTASSLSDLVSANPVSSVFQNGQLKQSSRLNDTTVVQTGVLASDAGGPLMSALQAVAAYNAGPNGPFGATLTADQQSFLSGVLDQFNAAVSSANTVTADNGVIAKQVADATTSLTEQQTAVQGVVSNLTTPDEAKVASQLTLAQTTLQASAEVYSSLQSDSLLQLLSPTTTA